MTTLTTDTVETTPPVKPVAKKKWSVTRRGWTEPVGDQPPQPLYHYEGADHLLVTGPLKGTVTMTDGTIVDVSPDVIAVDSLEQALELSHHIGIRHEEEGHPRHAPTEKDPFPAPFLHVCTEMHCGPLARPVTHPMQAMAMARAQWVTDNIADGAVRSHFAETHGTSDGGPSMALASNAAENAALNGLDGTGSTNVVPDVSLHTATTSTTGTAETANSGSYARQACTWNAAASGSKTNSTALTFSTLGTIAVTHIGTWSSATYAAGTFAIGAALGSSVTSASITIASGAITWSAT